VTHVLRLGLTGGIGSGKSTVAAMLEAHGAKLVDADAISRAVSAAGGLAIRDLAREFGAQFITPEGALDRERMRELVYGDAGAKKRLEAIVHPLVGQEIARQTDVFVQAGAACIVFDIPLLVESTRWRQNLDRVLVVDCPPELQIERVVKRNALARESVVQIIQAQAPRTLRLKAADMVIYNGPITLAQLTLEVAGLAARLGLSSRQRPAVQPAHGAYRKPV
jgi:dephospho-CoA kinase